MNKQADNQTLAENVLEGKSEALCTESISTGDAAIVEAVFGDVSESRRLVESVALKTAFSPWHHPTKQIVRDYQWGDLTKQLMQQRPVGHRDILRYFTLPGADLFDVRVLANALKSAGSRIEYFGFDAGYHGQSGTGDTLDRGVYFATESALRQAGHITDSAEILSDRLEDIAQPGTQAANRLKQQRVFDVINIDACEHLGFVPKGRTTSIFDALEQLLAHQLPAADPWLLFITTRVDPTLMGMPTVKLQGAIHNNLGLHTAEFGTALAECIGAKLQTLSADMNARWTTHDMNFLKLFCVGLGKYLLQFYHGQHNLPADVELASAMTYKVHIAQPDMLSLAFRITPAGLRVQPATASGTSAVSPLELHKALRVTERAKKLWDVDSAMEKNENMRKEAVLSTADLLRSADYDVPAWSKWLAGLALRPMKVDDLIA